MGGWRLVGVDGGGAFSTTGRRFTGGALDSNRFLSSTALIMRLRKPDEKSGAALIMGPSDTRAGVCILGISGLRGGGAFLVGGLGGALGTSTG